MDKSVRTETLRRLNYISGHVTGIKKMVEDDRYCVDILKQSYAVRRALQKLDAIILEGHLRTCAIEGIRDDNATQVIEELLDLYEQSSR